MAATSFAGIGHSHIRRWLAAAIASRRLSGSYLFLGPPGIGKRGLAVEFAAALRCASRVGDWACGRCNECARIAAGVHPNVRQYAKPDDLRDLPVELVREICEAAALTRMEPGRRVFIVDDADRFNESSANAFLKTLEEPPADLTFILLAGNAAQVLPTILSRCQVVHFAPLNAAELAQVTTAWPELAELDAPRRELLLRAAQGSAGRLRRLVEADALTLSRDFLDGVREDPFRAAEALASGLARGLPAEGASEQSRERLRDVLAIVSGVVRDRMAAGEAFAGVAPLLGPARGADLGTSALVDVLTRIDDLRERVDANANLKLVCDALALSLPS